MNNLTDIKFSLVDETGADCKWVKSLVDTLVQTYPDWDQNLNKFLFQYRTGQLKSFNSSQSNVTPFSAIFNHNPINVIELDSDDENKENIDDQISITEKKNPCNNSFKVSLCYLACVCVFFYYLFIFF